MRDYNIFVEGVADSCFFRQYLRHLFGETIPTERVVVLNGWDRLKTEASAVRMRSMNANGGVNLVIFDADDDIETRRQEVETIKEQYHVEFELFLFPNNQDTGALEDLLENIINPDNHSIMDCWEDYEKELVKLDIPGRTPPPLTTPAKKTKIYGYLEALLFKNQKELIKEKKRDYENTKHWNLDAEYLEPLKEFLQKWL